MRNKVIAQLLQLLRNYYKLLKYTGVHTPQGYTRPAGRGTVPTPHVRDRTKRELLDQVMTFVERFSFTRETHPATDDLPLAATPRSSPRSLLYTSLRCILWLEHYRLPDYHGHQGGVSSP